MTEFPAAFGFRNREAHEIRDRISETGRLPRFREPRCDRRENVASVERIAHRIAKIVLRSNIPDVQRFRLVIDGRKNAIIGRDKIVLIACHKDGTPRRSDAWVNHDEMNRFRREIFVGVADRERAVENVVSDNSVRDINDIHFGINRENDAFEYAGEMVGGSIIRCERNNWAGQCLLL